MKESEEEDVEMYTFKWLGLNHTIARSAVPEHIYQREEFRRCKESHWYFYTNYVMIDGKKATTELTEEEFNKTF